VSGGNPPDHYRFTESCSTERNTAVFIYTLPVAAVSVDNGFMMVANEKVRI